MHSLDHVDSEYVVCRGRRKVAKFTGNRNKHIQLQT